MADATSTVRGLAGLTEERALAAARERDEPQWLLDRRAEAARAYAALPVPTPALRPWKYTDITDLDLGSYEPSDLAITVEGATDLGEDSPLGTLVTADDGKFAAANLALAEPVVLSFARNEAVAEPILVELDAKGGAVFPRLLIEAADGAEATVLLRLRSGDEPLFAAGVTEIFAGQGAHVRLLIDQRWGAQTVDISTLRARLGRDADVNVATMAFGAKLFKQTTEALIEGSGANSTIRGVALGDGEQHFDFVTLQDHTGEHSTSDVQIKAALAGASKSIYYGITRVGETAAGAEANQQNRNLLLSRRAKADSDPVLEILTSEVIQCAHGATVGPVDEEALFYLQSRGLDRRQALQLLVAGFFQSVAGGIPVAGVADEISELVHAKLALAEIVQ
jgi:Fe-S cluster assembly protein SufD